MSVRAVQQCRSVPALAGQLAAVLLPGLLRPGPLRRHRSHHHRRHAGGPGQHRARWVDSSASKSYIRSKSEGS